MTGRAHLLLLTAFLLLLPTMAAAQNAIYKYTDDDGNSHFTQDPGAVPQAYRDSIQEVRSAPEPEPGLWERIENIFVQEKSELPPERTGAPRPAGGKSTSSRSGSPGSPSAEGKRAGSAGDGAGSFQKMGKGSSGGGGLDGGGPAAGGVGADGAGASAGGDGAAGQGADLGINADNIDINIDELQQQVDQYQDSPLFQRLIVALVAAFQSGFFWVVLLAIVVFGFILATRSLLHLEDNLTKRRFWKWGFPILSVIGIYVLAQITYPPYQAIYRDLLRILNL